MLRILIFILSVVFVASAVTYFAGMEEWIKAEAFGNKIDIHAGAAMAISFFAFCITILFTSWFKDLVALPEKIKRKEREARQTRGMAALARGLEAVAVGNSGDAQHHARVAHRNLDNAALTRLLSAQAAQIAGDDAKAGESFTAMLEAPETEFLGLHGLFQKAMRNKDKVAAQGYADRAFKLRPNAKWAFDSVFELGLDRGAWGETRSALTIAQKNKIINAEEAKRGEAALLTADAYAADLSANKSIALQEAEAALKIAPAFAPAAVLAAQCHAENDRASRAAKILEHAFSVKPHPSLPRAIENIFADKSVEERAKYLKKIADRKPTAREAKLAYARRHILLEEFDEAILILEPMLMETATVRETAAMAEAVAGAHGADAAKVWLEKAANAPRDPNPGAEGSFHFTKDGWARLVREYMQHDRLTPPPLEDAPRGLSVDELKLLASPPPKTPTPVDTPGEDAGTSDGEAGDDPTQASAETSTDNEKPADAATLSNDGDISASGDNDTASNETSVSASSDADSPSPTVNKDPAAKNAETTESTSSTGTDKNTLR